MLITKVERDYHGIGLVEVVWKMVTAIHNFRLAASIDFRGILRGFWAGLGTSTTSLEAKLIQKLMAMIVSVGPFPLDESVPTEGDIKWEVRSMRDNRSGGLSRIRAEHLQQWLWEAQKE